MSGMPRQLPPYVQKETTRHGKTVYYARPYHHGPRIRLRAAAFTQEWWAEYRVAMEHGAAAEPVKRGMPKQGTLEWLISQYRLSTDWARLSVTTRKQRENIYLRVIESAGHAPLRALDRKAVERGRDKRAATPFAAKNYLKAMRMLFRWAVLQGYMQSNPADGVSIPLPKNHTGFHTWTEEEIERFQQHWPHGTRERVAFDILLYTGLRRGDAVVLGRQHVREDAITIRAEKTQRELTIPLLPALAATLTAGPTGDLIFISGTRGQPMTKESFGNWFRDACRAAGCPGAAHGLRKAAARRLAEGGATVNQLMAWFDWSDERMAVLYTRKAERAHLAREAGTLLERKPPAPKTRRPHPKKDAL